MNQAIIFALDNNWHEPKYDMMAVLLVKSIRQHNPDIDIYCGVFTNRVPSDRAMNIIKEMGVKVVTDQTFTVGEYSCNYFLRSYCCHYFSDLLDEYDQLIYLDVDVLVLKPLNITIPDNSVMVELVPKDIADIEAPYIDDAKFPMYYNWVTIVNKNNKYLWDMDYDVYRELKHSDVEVSKRINISWLSIVHQDIGAYYPKHELKDDTILFHYDGFIDSGSFWRLAEYDEMMYRQYLIYAERVLGLKNENDKEYWNVGEKICVPYKP